VVERERKRKLMVEGDPRQSHYFYADVASQFDAVVHIDWTRAVEPLDRTPMWDTGEVPETYPSGV
jgi:erythromycin esterase-like protein